MKRILVFIIGVVFVFICLELGLRGLGALYRSQMIASQLDGARTGGEQFVILCLGNSYTKGVGSNMGMSYPEQLQRMFFTRRPEKKAVVLNLGRSVQNTSELLAALDANLDRFKPNLVLLQTGQANHWNRLGYTDYLKRERRTVSWGERIKYFTSELVYSSRVYRLFLLWRNHADGQKKTLALPEAPVDISYRGSPEYRKACQFIRNSTASRRKKDFAVDPRESQEAMEVFMRAAEKDPSHPLNYVFVGYIYRFQKKYEEALRWFIKGVEVNTRFRSSDEINEGYKEIREMRLEDKGPDHEVINQKIDAFIEEFNRKNPDLAENLFLLTPLQLEQWVVSDTREIVRKIRASGAAVILQNYPVGIPENALFRRMAAEDSLWFVDQYALFEDQLRAGVPREKLFIPDNHCNDYGYGLMAENVYQKIMEAGL